MNVIERRRGGRKDFGIRNLGGFFSKNDNNNTDDRLGHEVESQTIDDY
jgi:hypothetical protein